MLGVINLSIAQVIILVFICTIIVRFLTSDTFICYNYESHLEYTQNTTTLLFLPVLYSGVEPRTDLSVIIMYTHLEYTQYTTTLLFLSVYYTQVFNTGQIYLL